MTQYLYLIKCKSSFQEFFKVGIASDVESRLAQLQTGNPLELSIEDVYEFDNAEIVERAIHQAWKSLRVRGEWFEGKGADTVSRFQDMCDMLGGEHYVPDNYEVSEDDIAEAEEVQEASFSSYDPETMRTEIRMSNGSPRGVVVLTRSAPKLAIAYIGKKNPEFEKYVHIYKQEHPESRLAL